MHFGRPFTQHQAGGNLPIALSLGHERRHFAFARGEAAIHTAGQRLLRARFPLGERDQTSAQEMLA